MSWAGPETQAVSSGPRCPATPWEAALTCEQPSWGFCFWFLGPFEKVHERSFSWVSRPGKSKWPLERSNCFYFMDTVKLIKPTSHTRVQVPWGDMQVHLRLVRVYLLEWHLHTLPLCHFEKEKPLKMCPWAPQGCATGYLWEAPW